MADVKFRLLDEDQWQLYREVRLAALEDAPEAFVARLEDEADRDEKFWRERMSRASRIVAEREDVPVGLVGLGRLDEDPEAGEVFGLWTAPAVRGQRVARGLVSMAARKSIDDGCRQALLLGCLRQRICDRLREQLRLSSHLQTSTGASRWRVGRAGRGRGRHGAVPRIGSDCGDQPFKRRLAERSWPRSMRLSSHLALACGTATNPATS